MKRRHKHNTKSYEEDIWKKVGSDKRHKEAKKNNVKKEEEND